MLQTSLVTKLHRAPISVGGAAVYEYNKHIIDACTRKSKYKDDDGNDEYNLCRVVGVEHPRIWVPRNMASTIPIDLRMEGQNITFQSSFKPRNDEQSRVIKETVALLKAGDNFMVRAPTGFGKTICAMDIIAKVGKKTIVVVPKEDVLDQWLDAAEKVLGLTRGKGVGIIRADTFEAEQPFVIAMVQSISKEGRYPEAFFAQFGLAIWDECHRIAADFFSQSCFRIPAYLRFGLTATPKRKDDRDEVLHAHIGPVKVWTDLAPMTPKVIIEKSPWQCPLKRKVDKEGNLVMDKAGNIQMVPIPHTAGRTAHIENMLKKHHGRNLLLCKFTIACFKAGRKVIVQSKQLEHLEILQGLLVSLGIHPKQITNYVGGLSKVQREQAKTGQIIMATYTMTKEATDIPDLDTLVMAMPISDCEQAVGRVIRFLEGKKEPVVYDLVDDTSPVFAGYADQRRGFYRRIKAPVQLIATKEKLTN